MLDPRGALVASGLAGEGARALAFSPVEDLLLITRPHGEGTDLLTWKAPRGPLRRVLVGEEGLAWAGFAPTGKALLVLSSTGARRSRRDDETARRRTAPREGLPDYLTGPHLHLVDLATGNRRRLTLPGDFVLDGACFADDSHVVYARTVPRRERPWFQTELREIDLRSGADRLLRVFVAGWEFRPRALIAEPAGERVAFLGPPAELGPGRGEHNVYNAQIWVLDRASGSLERITGSGAEAYGGRGGVLVWAGAGRMVATATTGARRRWVRVEETDDGWNVLPLPAEGEVLTRAAASSDGRFLASVLSSPTRPAALFFTSLEQGTGNRVEELTPPSRKSGCSARRGTPPSAGRAASVSKPGTTRPFSPSKRAGFRWWSTPTAVPSPPCAPSTRCTSSSRPTAMGCW
ncbi:MAG: hypothetical protein Q9Q13_03330 [Acidobacteriota bacterium]|nr:hypothetical protein [Acidobacteriota bacterium]